jgi:hypothetical protein
MESQGGLKCPFCEKPKKIIPGKPYAFWTCGVSFDFELAGLIKHVIEKHTVIYKTQSGHYTAEVQEY